MKAPDSGCRIASSAQFLCSAFAARYVYFTSQRSQVSRPGRPPHKSNFYCHPGRAGGTPILLGSKNRGRTLGGKSILAIKGRGRCRARFRTRPLRQAASFAEIGAKKCDASGESYRRAFHYHSPSRSMLIKASDKSLPDRPFAPTLPDNLPEIGPVQPRREVRAISGRLSGSVGANGLSGNDLSDAFISINLLGLW